jgi:hypothetical protein
MQRESFVVCKAIFRKSAEKLSLFLQCNIRTGTAIDISEWSKWRVQSPRPMCPWPNFLGYCIPWTKCPLDIVTLTKPYFNWVTDILMA